MFSGVLGILPIAGHHLLMAFSRLTHATLQTDFLTVTHKCSRPLESDR